MGLFDKLRRNRIEEPKREMPKEPQRVERPYDTTFSRTRDGKLQVDFHEKNPEFGQFYDMTRLVFNRETLSVLGHQLQKCKVSWYGEDDAIMIDKSTGEDMSRRADYKEILAEIDVNLMQTDVHYCEAVMKKLLNMKRVTEKLNMGLQEKPEKPCGNYVGGIKRTERGYQKFFRTDVGERVHNSEEMKNKRNKYREEKRANKEKEIDRRKEEISRLQSEIDEL